MSCVLNNIHTVCAYCVLYMMFMIQICWSHKLHKRLRIKIRKQAPCPLHLKHFDHTLFVAAVTEYNQQRWSRDSYLTMLNSADVFLSLSAVVVISGEKGNRFGGDPACPRISVQNQGTRAGSTHLITVINNWMFKAKKNKKISNQPKYWHCKMSEIPDQ